MAICKKCRRSKTGKNKTPEGRCAACRKKYENKRYKKSKKLYVWKGNEAKQRMIKRNQEFLLAYLKSHPCVDCGESHPLCLDFDHRDRELKTAGLTFLVRRFGTEKLITEIEKCDVRCANCHRKRTAQQMNHYRFQLLQLG